MLQGEQDDRDIDPRMELRANRGDKLHDLQLLRDLVNINARIVRERGPLPAGGLPAQVRLKPNLPHRPKPAAAQEGEMNPFQRIAATSALAASAVAACGEAHPPAQVMEATPTPTAPAPAPPPAPTPPPSAPNPPPVGSPEPVTDVAQVEIERGPANPAATLRKQVLALLDSLQTLKHLEREHVESIFKVRMAKNPRSRDGYHYFGQTTEGWTYYIDVARLYGLSEPPTITIGLSNGVQPWTDQKPTYCTLDFEELARDIVALGYERDATRSIYGNKPSWGFGRRTPATRTGFGVSVYLYYLDEGTEAERACVREFDIGGGLYRE